MLSFRFSPGFVTLDLQSILLLSPRSDHALGKCCIMSHSHNVHTRSLAIVLSLVVKIHLSLVLHPLFFLSVIQSFYICLSSSDTFSLASSCVVCCTIDFVSQSTSFTQGRVPVCLARAGSLNQIDLKSRSHLTARMVDILVSDRRRHNAACLSERACEVRRPHGLPIMD